MDSDLYITEDLLKEIKCGDKLIVISLKISNKISNILNHIQIYQFNIHFDKDVYILEKLEFSYCLSPTLTLFTVVTEL